VSVIGKMEFATHQQSQHGSPVRHATYFNLRCVWFLKVRRNFTPFKDLTVG